MFQAGAAVVDISPPKLPVIVNGGMLERTADRIVDRLHARALVLDDGSVRLAIVVVDSCMLPRDLLDTAKELASKATGIPTSHMLISATHTHSAPAAMGCLGSDADAAYAAWLPEQLARAIGLANENREPARIGWAKGTDAENIYCRRFLMKPGTAATNRFSGKKNDRAQMNPGIGNANALERTGPVDTDVYILAVETRGGRPLAVLGNYSTHYAGAPALSADYFAVFATRVGELIEADRGPGKPFVGMMSNATSGDANSIDFTRKDPRKFDYRTVGDDTARVAAEAYRGIQFHDWVPLAMRESLLELPVRMPTEEEVKEAREFLAGAEGKPKNVEQVYARETLILAEMPATRELKLQAIRIGGLGIAAIPNEVYGSTGLAIKKDSPLAATFTIELANGAEGYIPPPEQHELGGYTTWRARTSSLEEQAEPKIRGRIMELLAAVAEDRKEEKSIPSPVKEEQKPAPEEGAAAEPPLVPSPVSPEESLRWLYPKPGFVVELVAAEPLVADPVAFDWGPDGKLWVVEMHDYPLGLGKEGRPGSRIRYLEDTTGDGRYDASTVIADDLPFANGVCAWRNGCLVTAAPHIWYLQDADGDGRAEIREKLYEGFTEGNPQLRINGLVWGPDNWVHLANGLSSRGEIRSTKSGAKVEVQGFDVRIRPDTGEIETQTGASQFGVAFDDWGNRFGVSNANPLFHYVLEDRYLRRNPYVVPPELKIDVSETPRQQKIFPRSRPGRFFHESQAGRFTSANSAMFLRETAWGEQFHGNSFVSEPVHNLVHREIVEPKGVTFTSRRPADEQDREFLASADTWFRPATLRTGPDGALWLADMYREVIEHPQWIPIDRMLNLDLRSGSDRGRIYRIYPEKLRAELRPIPNLTKLEAGELVEVLSSSNGTVRDMARKFIVLEKKKECVVPLRKLAAEAPEAATRIAALETLAGLGALSAEGVLAAMSDEHAEVRRRAYRLSEDVLEAAPVSRFRGPEESDPRAIVQILCSAGCWSDEASTASLIRYGLSPYADPYVLAAAASSMNNEQLAKLVETMLASDPALGSGMFRHCAVTAAGRGENELAGRIIDRLLALAESDPTSAQLTQFADLLEALERVKFSVASLPQKLPKQAEGVEQLLALAAEGVASEKHSAEWRRAAMRLIGRDPRRRAEDIALLASLLSPQQETEVQAAAVQALARIGSPEAAAALLAGWRGHSPTVRGSAASALLAREPWTVLLLESLEAGKLAAADLDASARDRLLQHRNAALKARAEKLLAGGETDRAAVLAALEPVVNLKGDSNAGREVFGRRCIACHKLEGKGNDVGPSLAGLSDRSPRALLTAILDPSRAVEPKFLSYTVITTDGRSLAGVILEESGASLVLIDPTGQRIELLRSQIEELVSTGKSLMPEGLEKELSEQQLADVMAYVAAAKE